jgi:hypothetical protein
VLADGRLEVMRWQCRFMQVKDHLPTRRQRQQLHVAERYQGSSGVTL